MWTILRERSSQVGSAMQRTALHIRFQQMAPKPGAPISQFFTSLLDIRNQLSGTQQAIDDTMIKARIFATAPPEFETTSIYQQNLPEDTPLETIMDAFKRDESIRALRTDPPALKEALYSNTSNFRGRGRGRGGRGRGGRWLGSQLTKWCIHCQRNTHSTEECWSKKRSHDDDDDTDKKDLKCWHCGESGHTQRNCSIREKGQQAAREFKKQRSSGLLTSPKTSYTSLWVKGVTPGGKPAGVLLSTTLGKEPWLACSIAREREKVWSKQEGTGGISISLFHPV